MRRLNGVVPVLVTPLDESGEVDISSIGRLVEYFIEKNVGGLWVLGTGGEDMGLTFSQRLDVASAVAEANAGRLPIIMGCSFFSMKDSVDFLDKTAALQFDAYHAMPYHPLLSLDRIEAWYKKLADTASKPLWLYTSANWARFIPPEFVEKIKNYPNISGVKYSTSNIVHIAKVLSLADQDFQVIPAVVRTFYSTLSLGAHACTTVEACGFLDLINPIYDAFRSGYLERALECQKKLNGYLDMMPKGPGMDNFLHVAEKKYILSRMGLCQEHMAGYYRGLNQSEKNEIDMLANKLSLY